MTSRTRRKWKPDPRGYYCRQIGWVLSQNGKKQQQKFLLGKDLTQAERRERKLRELWDRYASGLEDDQPLWPSDLLQVAKLVARGVEEISVAIQSGETPYGYAERIRHLQVNHPVGLFVPVDQYFYDVGCAALHCFEKVRTGSAVEDMVALLPATPTSARLSEKTSSERTRPRRMIGNVAPASARRTSINNSSLVSQKGHGEGLALKTPAIDGSPSQSSATAPSLIETKINRQSLHQAFNAYQEFIQREYYRPEMAQLTPWGQTQKKQIDLLKEHHENRLLIYLNADVVNEMIAYWRRRPVKKGADQPMTAKSSSNYLGTLVRFFKWLHNSSTFAWTKPFAFSDINTRVQTLSSDHANRQLEQVETFSLQELQLLMRYGQPLDRLLLLLALNCGFGRAEISSLLIREIKLHEAHSAWQCELLNYRSTPEDSFIKRVRRKSGVYGEHLLFPLTVQGIQWAIEERKKHPGFSENSRLLLNDNGKPFDHPTKSGNFNQTIPNRLARLVNRIRDDGHQVRDLSFGKLRKTASQLIKTFSDGEVMGVFDCHGRPVKSDSLTDVYSNRPFGRVFSAIKKVQQYLAPVFAAAGVHPFKRQPEAYTKLSTINRIFELRDAGNSVEKIANELSISHDTVSRHLKSRCQSSKTSRSE